MITTDQPASVLVERGWSFAQRWSEVHSITQNNSVGADGKICTWNVQDGTLDDASLQSTLQLQPQYGGAAKGPVVRAMCVSPLDKDIMVGTSACDIWEVNDNKQV